MGIGNVKEKNKLEKYRIEYMSIDKIILSNEEEKRLNEIIKRIKSKHYYIGINEKEFDIWMYRIIPQKKNNTDLLVLINLISNN